MKYKRWIVFAIFNCLFFCLAILAKQGMIENPIPNIALFVISLIGLGLTYVFLSVKGTP